MISLNPGDKLRTPDDDLKAGDLLSTFKQKNFHLMQSYFCNFRDGNFGMHFYYLVSKYVLHEISAKIYNKLHADKNELK